MLNKHGNMKRTVRLAIVDAREASGGFEPHP